MAVPEFFAQRLRRFSHLSPSHNVGYCVRVVERSVSGVGVLDKAMRILDVLGDARPRNLGELVSATGLPRATAHRLAHALQAHGLTALGSDDRWSLGPRVGELAGRAPSLDEAAGPALAALRDATGESVQLFVPRAGARV